MPLYEEIEIEDMTYDKEKKEYWYPCPCGDKFRIGLEELWDGEDIAKCPSCSLRIMVIFDQDDLPPFIEDSDDDEDSSGESSEKEPDEDNKEGKEKQKETPKPEEDAQKLAEKLQTIRVK